MKSRTLNVACHALKKKALNYYYIENEALLCSLTSYPKNGNENLRDTCKHSRNRKYPIGKCFQLVILAL